MREEADKMAERERQRKEREQKERADNEGAVVTDAKDGKISDTRRMISLNRFPAVTLPCILTAVDRHTANQSISLLPLVLHPVMPGKMRR